MKLERGLGVLLALVILGVAAILFNISAAQLGKHLGIGGQ